MRGQWGHGDGAGGSPPGGARDRPPLTKTGVRVSEHGPRSSRGAWKPPRCGALCRPALTGRTDRRSDGLDRIAGAWPGLGRRGPCAGSTMESSGAVSQEVLGCPYHVIGSHKPWTTHGARAGSLGPRASLLSLQPPEPAGALGAGRRPRDQIRAVGRAATGHGHRSCPPRSCPPPGGARAPGTEPPRGPFQRKRMRERGDGGQPRAPHPS